jgi:hypothetical protein
MNKKFFLTGVAASFSSLLLNAAAYVIVLKDFYRAHPTGSEEFMKQLHRPPGQLIVWALAVSALAMGFLVTTAMKWSGARTVASGLKRGFVFAALFWGSVNFGLYASSNLFSSQAVFVDYACSVAAMTLSGTLAAWLLGQGEGPYPQRQQQHMVCYGPDGTRDRQGLRGGDEFA